MTSKTISPLRQRMIEDMTVRSFDPRTQGHYIRAVKKLRRRFSVARPPVAGRDTRRAVRARDSPVLRSSGDGESAVAAEVARCVRVARDEQAPVQLLDWMIICGVGNDCSPFCPARSSLIAAIPGQTEEAPVAV